MADIKDIIEKLNHFNSLLDDSLKYRTIDGTQFRDAEKSISATTTIFGIKIPLVGSPISEAAAFILSSPILSIQKNLFDKYSFLYEFYQDDIVARHLEGGKFGLTQETMQVFDATIELKNKADKIYIEIQKDIKEKNEQSSLNPKLEIAILSDTTGSMNGEIKSVKAQAKKIVETAFSKDENARIGVFGYNDPNVQTFTALTNNKSAIISAINALYARDGGDTPEMTYKGIINAASSSWSPNADKKIIIFGDAPAKDTYNKAEAYALLSGGSSDEPMARLALPASVLSLLAGESQSAELETSNDTSKIKVYAIQTGGGSDVEKEFKELAELSGGEYIKLENDSDVAQIILNIIEHGSVDLGKSYELDFSSEKNSQIIANEYGSIVINDELENLIFNYKNNDLIIKHPNSGTQAIIKDFLTPNNELSKIKIRSEILEFSQIKELAYAQSGKDSVIYAKSSEGDFSLNDNISVFFSSDKNTATNITINNKKDNYIISSLKDDNITLGFGNDTFIYKGGRDSLKDSGGNDRVVFENISFNSAKFSKENYNLKISLGASNELVVGNYFKEGKIEDFQFSDKELKSDEINLLI